MTVLDRPFFNEAFAGDEPCGSADPAGVGAALAQARLRAGLTIEGVAARLRAQPAQLIALERGDASAFAAPAYAIGHLRGYATALGLDADALARRYAPPGAAMPAPAIHLPHPPVRWSVPAGAVALLGALVLLGGYVAFGGGAYSPPARVAAVPERLAPLAMAVAPRPAPSPQVAAVLPEPSALPAEPTPPASIPPSQAAAAMLPPPQIGASLAVRVSADAWVQIRDRRDGSMLLNRLVHAGETWPVPPGRDLALTTGNAGGTRLVVDGIAGPPLGADGAVQRDLPLTADSMPAMSASTPPANPQ